MNERIKELIEQATESTGFLTAGDSVKPLPVREFNKEKFALLIVQECLDQCYNRGMNDELYAGQLKAAAYIEEHFGVEE